MDIIYTLIKIIAGGAILLGGISLAIVIISAIVSKFNKKLVDKAVDKLDNAIDYLEKMEKRIEYDLYYVNNWSFWMDIQILFKTPLAIMSLNAH